MRLRLGTFVFVSALLLLSGCGKMSPSAVQAQSGSYSDATLTGSYAVALSGTEGISTGQIAEFDIMASLTASGTGQITGTYSEFINYLNNPSMGVNPTGNCTGTVSGGTYSINSNGYGTATMTFAPSSTQSCLNLPASFEISTNPAGSSVVLAEMDGTAVSSGTGIFR
jgi:hypothetical protein